MKKTIVIAIAAIGLTSCNKTSFEYTTINRYHDQDKSDVLVITDGREVPKGAEEIGIIYWSARSEHKAIKRARREGARHGANAVYYVLYKGKKELSRCNHGTFKAVYIKPQAK